MHKPSEMFRTYEDQYKAHMEQVMLNLLKMTQKHQEIADQELKKVENEIAETESCLQQMELEASTLPAVFRKDLVIQLKQYKQEISKAEKELRKIQYDNSDSLMANKLFDGRQINEALLNQEDRLNQQNLKLLGAKQVINQVDDQAIQIQRNLHYQSQGMTNMITKTQGIRDDLGESNTLVNIMKNRVMQRKLLVYGTFAFLSLCGAVVVYNWLT